MCISIEIFISKIQCLIEKKSYRMSWFIHSSNMCKTHSTLSVMHAYVVSWYKHAQQ